MTTTPPTSTTPTKKSRRQKSPQDVQADTFLKATLAPHRRAVLLAWAIDVLSVLVLVGLIFVLAGLFGELLALHQAQSIKGGNVILGAKPLVVGALPIIGGCLVARLILTSVRESILASVGVKMAISVRKQALQAVGKLGLARRAFGADGALASHIIKEPDELFGFARFNVQKMTAVSTPMILGLVIAYVNVRSALILLATAPFVVLAMAVIGIKTAKNSREQLDALAQMSGRFLDWLRGVNTLTRLQAINTASDDVARSAGEYKHRTMQVLKVAFLNSTALEFFSALAIALVAVYLGFGLLGKLSWSQGVAIIDYRSALFILLLVPEFYLPLKRLGAEYHAKSSAVACAKVLAPLCATSPPTKPPLHLNDYGVVLDNVSVTTGGRTRLTSLSLTVAQGQKWAIMGASGSGKSTLFEVLLGVADYDGSAKMGGQELKAVDVTTAYSDIGYLAQTPALLPISIAENLRLAKSDVSDDELMELLKKVGLSEILALPNSIHTVLSERGGGLSGGQAQRLAIAQLLLQNAKLWLLDEPTEHLDKDTKADIHALLYQLSQNKTVLWATHDTPVSWLDGVYVIDNHQHFNQETSVTSSQETIENINKGGEYV